MPRVLPAYQEDWDGVWQAGLSIGSASAIGLIGKHTIDAPRPDGSDNKSFPSNHTANAFASATTLHIRHGWQVGLPAYGVATPRWCLDEYKPINIIGVMLPLVPQLAHSLGGSLPISWIQKVQLLPWATPHSSGVSVTYVW